MINRWDKRHFGKRNMRGSRCGVSEIIGQLLILAITVTMFSSVLFFVLNMPQPQDQTVSDFSAETGVSGSNFYVNVTHEGGQTLSGPATNIYLYLNEVPLILNISSSNPSIGPDWNIGQVWSYVVTEYSGNIAVRMMVVDKTANSIVWQATLAGASDKQITPPIIGTRGLTPFPVYDQNNVTFFVTVTALNSDVSAAWVNASSLGITGNVTLYDADHDGTFSSIDSYTASHNDWNGRTIFFSAIDNAGNSVTGQFVVAVLWNPPVSGTANGNGTSNATVTI
jgi:hypothetical protein